MTNTGMPTMIPSMVFFRPSGVPIFSQSLILYHQEQGSVCDL